MPHRQTHVAYTDPEADYRVAVDVSDARCQVVLDFRRFPVIRDRVDGSAIHVDAGDNFEGLLELVRELVIEGCDQHARDAGDVPMLAYIDAYRRRALGLSARLSGTAAALAVIASGVL